MYSIPLPGSNWQVMLMDRARSTASFDSRELRNMIYKGIETVGKREAAFSRVEHSLGNSNEIKLPAIYGDLTRTEMYHNGLDVGKALLEEQINYRHGIFDRTTNIYAPINSSPFGLHPVMFIPTIKLQATPEQAAYWLPLAESGKIIGTYCQTELGHGTFVRGLETTATFDSTSDEFIIHSPTITSTKYWPGGLGFSCTHAVVMARLIVKGEDHGIHPFMVQLRSLEDHKALPGIELGDIGLKIGLNSTDNGYAIFDHVRIPRTHLLMRDASLNRDGTYIKAPHSKLAYGTMIFTRNAIVHIAGMQLAQAVTIAIRYSVVREQGSPDNSIRSKEVPIMTYKSQHYRLLSWMSRAFAIIFAADTCENIYQDLVAQQRQGNHSSLPYGHLTTASLKAYATQNATDGAEDARKCCGGHGYSSLSGLPGIVASVTPLATLEGENYVMYQQAARYLVKCASAIRTGQPVDAPMSYLVRGFDEMNSNPIRRCSGQGSEFLSPEMQLSIYRYRAVRLIFECEELLRDAQAHEGLSAAEAWDAHMMSLISAAHAHAEYFVLSSFVDHVLLVNDPSVRRVLKHTCDLYALVGIESPLAIGSIGFFEDGYISHSQLRAIRTQVNYTLGKLLPEAVALTDAWNFSDASLQSALGRKDGNVYETLLEWTRQIPLNVKAAQAGGVDRIGYEKYIRPILQAKPKL